MYQHVVRMTELVESERGLHGVEPPLGILSGVDSFLNEL
jgi:hypothetical protein